MDHFTEPHTVSHRSTLPATTNLTTTTEPASTIEPLTTATKMTSTIESPTTTAESTTIVEPSTITTAELLKHDLELDIFETETDCSSMHQSGGGVDSQCQPDQNHRQSRANLEINSKSPSTHSIDNMLDSANNKVNQRPRRERRQPDRYGSYVAAAKR